MNRFLTSVVVGLAGIQGLSLEASSRPKLVVGIVVDQLRTDYLELLQDKFGPGGFRRLMEQGAFFKDVDFKVPSPDGASATAILQTGTYPRQNGVAGYRIYSPADKRAIDIFTDRAYIGNFTDETFSPAALRVSTLSDEIAVATDGKANIHSVAPNAADAIILAGHAAQSAFWINNETGKWSSTTFYTGAPQAIQNRNYQTPLLLRLDSMKWVPSRLADSYPDIPVEKIREGFRYTFPRSDRDVYQMYKKSPFINSDITSVATDYLKSLNLGKNSENTDVLNLSYTLAPFQAVTGNGRYEMEDAYLRLDNDLAALFKEIDKNVGNDNVLVYLASTGYYAEPEIEASRYRLPTGTFSVKRSMSLLNAYLTAKYGNANYIDSYSGSHVFLDRTAIEAKNLSVEKVAEEARDFLVKMSGVADAYTVADLMSPAVAQLEGHRLANDPKTAGDIIIEFNPGWKVVDDTEYFQQVLPVHSTAYLTPAFIFGKNIAPQVIESPVEASAFAPTVASILRIRPPNGAISKPLQLKKK